MECRGGAATERRGGYVLAQYALDDARRALCRGDLAAAVEALQLADTARGQHAPRREARALLTRLWAAMNFPPALCPRAGADEVARRGSCANLAKTLGRTGVIGGVAHDASNTVKCVIVGDGAVGKTSLLHVLNHGQFPDEWMTCRSCFEPWMSSHTVDGCHVFMHPWDTAGQVDYVRLRPLSYPDTDIFVIAYTVDRRQSFEAVAQSWLPELLFHCSPSEFNFFNLSMI